MSTATTTDVWDEIRPIVFPNGMRGAWDPENFEEEFQRTLASGIRLLNNTPEKMMLLRRLFTRGALYQCTIVRADNMQGERTAAIKAKIAALGIPLDPITDKEIEGLLPGNIANFIAEKETRLQQISAEMQQFRLSMNSLEEERTAIEADLPHLSRIRQRKV